MLVPQLHLPPLRRQTTRAPVSKRAGCLPKPRWLQLGRPPPAAPERCQSRCRPPRCRREGQGMPRSPRHGAPRGRLQRGSATPGPLSGTHHWPGWHTASQPLVEPEAGGVPRGRRRPACRRRLRPRFGPPRPGALGLSRTARATSSAPTSSSSTASPPNSTASGCAGKGRALLGRHVDDVTCSLRRPGGFPCRVLGRICRVTAEAYALDQVAPMLVGAFEIRTGLGSVAPGSAQCFVGCFGRLPSVPRPRASSRASSPSPACASRSSAFVAAWVRASEAAIWRRRASSSSPSSSLARCIASS